MPSFLSLCLRTFGISATMLFSVIFPASFSQYSIVQQSVLPTSASVTSQNREVVFYVSSQLVTDLNFAKVVLPKYVLDMNTILAKNTNLQLSFDPNMDIVVVDDIASLPTYCCDPGYVVDSADYKIVAYVDKSQSGNSFGGFANYNPQGDSLMAGMFWAQLYDPDALNTPDEHDDYWKQVNNMLHELGHTYGVAYGEYYSLANVHDNTGVEPVVNLNSINFNDVYWNAHSYFFVDPMLTNIMHSLRTNDLPKTRQGALENAQYSPLTAAIIDGAYRGKNADLRVPDMDHVHIKVVDKDSGIGLAGANVKIWQVKAIPGNEATLRTDAYTATDGSLGFDWSANALIHNNYELLRLIKVYKEGYFPAVNYYSVFDAEEVKILQNNDLWTIVIPLESDGTLVDSQLPSVSFVSPAVNATVANVVDVNVLATDDVGIASVGLFVNGEKIGEDTTAPYSFSWNSQGYLPGKHSLTAVAYDTSGNLAKTARTVFVENDLVVSYVTMKRVSTSTASAVWTTNLPTTGTIYYSTQPFSTSSLSGVKSVSSSVFKFKHSLLIQKLLPGRTYYIAVRSQTKAGVTVFSPVFKFVMQ